MQSSLHTKNYADATLLSQMQAYLSEMLVNERQKPKIEQALVNGLARLEERLEIFKQPKPASRIGSSASQAPRQAAAGPRDQSAQPMPVDPDDTVTCNNPGSSSSGGTYSAPADDEVLESQAVPTTTYNEQFKTGMDLLGEAVSLLQQSGSPLGPRKKSDGTLPRSVRRSTRKRSNEEEQVRRNRARGGQSSTADHEQAKNKRRRILLDDEPSPPS